MLRGIWVWAVVVLATFGCALPAAVITMLRPGSHATMRFGRIWSKLILAAAGVRPSYEGLDHASDDEPRIFISNHQSLVDIWALTLALPLRARYVAKESLFRIPLMGRAMAASGFIPIDRTNRVRAVRSLQMAAQNVRAGRSLVLFAEGTRSLDGRLAPFKKGAFHLALEAGVPVVPVAISGSSRVLPAGSFRVTPGPVRVCFAPPIDPGRFARDDVESLREAVRRAIVERLAPDEAPLEPELARAAPH